jgi:hypothetical protein
MDDGHFDVLTKTFSAVGSRRSTVGALFGGLIATWFSLDESEGKHAHRRKKKSHRKPGRRPQVLDPGDPTIVTCGPGRAFSPVSGTCVSLSTGCGATTNNAFCVTDQYGPNGPSPCPNRAGKYGWCALADDGPFCGNNVYCTGNGTDACQTTADCVKEEYGPNVHCVQDCNGFCGPGVSGCVSFYLDFGGVDDPGCAAYGEACTQSADCCSGGPCTGDQDGSNRTCRYP